MSYTLAYQGAEIDDILGRAAPGGAIDTAIATKQNALTFDAVPTHGSTNPAESGGIYDAIQAEGAAALAAFATDTVSGDVVSFPDGANGIPVKSFTGSILPQQNLNGQSAPYPAGGGKNKLPLPAAAAAVGVTLTVNTDGSITLTGTATSAVTFDFFAAGTFDSTAFAGYIFSAGANWAGSTSGYSVRVMSGSTAAQVITANETAIADNGSGLRLMLRVGSGTAFPSGGLKLYPMLRASGTDNTFVPYSNICPISGWTGAEIYRTGVNVWDEQWENGYYDSGTPASGAGIRSKAANYIGVKPNTTYYCKCGVSANIAMSYYDASQAYISNYVVSGGSGTFTTPSNCFYLRFHVASGYGATYNHDISINYPSTDTDYHASEQAQTILLSFGQTVYAGTLTALGGGLWQVQPTHKIDALDSHTWNYGGNNRFNATGISDMKQDGLRSEYIYCSCYAPNVGGGAFDPFTIYNGTGGYVYVVDDRTTDGATLKTLLAGQYMVYPLATLPDPITITASDLQTLLGANTVWLDCGAVTGMTYRADTALYIQKLLNGGGTLSTLSMASPSPSLSLGRVEVLAEPEEVTEEPEAEERTEEATEE